jgi:hypothetical protein
VDVQQRAPYRLKVRERSHPTTTPSSGTSPTSASRSVSCRHASTIAQLHETVPIEPPASIAGPKALSPIRTRTSCIGAPSASAAIWVSTVRAPVPLSAAVTRTVNVPSASAVAEAVEVMVRAG